MAYGWHMIGTGEIKVLWNCCYSCAPGRIRIS
jgi:hypothetical protein